VFILEFSPALVSPMTLPQAHALGRWHRVNVGVSVDELPSRHPIQRGEPRSSSTPVAGY